MGGTARNNTLLCLMTVYGIHGVFFHVLSSPPVLVTSVIVKPTCLRNIITKGRTSFNTSFYNNQSFPVVNKTKNNVSVHLPVTYHTNIIGKNMDAWIQIETDSSPSEVPLKENLLLDKSGKSGSSINVDDLLLDPTTSSTASSTLSIMTFFSSDVTVLKIFSPSAWGVFIGCLVFLFTSTDREKESASR